MEGSTPSEYETEGEESIEELSASLKAHAKQVGEVFLECRDHFISFHKRIREDMEPIEEAKLIPKERMRVWLQAHALPEHGTFQEFFQAFIQDHKKEGRLDVSNRSIHLNKEARTLLGYRSPEAVVPILDLLEKLTNLFE
jgi:hypothetical protein